MVSLDSIAVSLATAMLKLLLVSPAAKLSVPDVGVKSWPLVAVPALVE